MILSQSSSVTQLELAEDRHAGVVEHQVEPAVPGDRRVDGGLQILAARDVHAHGRGFTAGTRYLGGHAVDSVNDIGHPDMRAGRRQLQRDLAADAAGRAGHDRGLAVEDFDPHQRAEV